ncbi:unnamed protein product [Effrenium voratum]|nr:unnamed protein product [Effrenium voratum]
MGEESQWLTVIEASFCTSRKGLVGPTARKVVVPVVGRRFPDEIFSFLRGCGLLNSSVRPSTERKIQGLRSGSDADGARKPGQGWQPFFARLVPEVGLAHTCARITDFPQQDADAASRCRRVVYQLNEDASGIDVRVQVNLHTAFALLLHGIRFPALGYEGDWRVSQGVPAELGKAKGAPSFRLLDNKLDARHAQVGLKHPLRPEQLRSLSWMLQQESSCTPLTMIYRCYWQRARPEEEAPKSLAIDWTLDCRIIASFRARSGILADEMGYGKTVLAIALHEARQEEEFGDMPEVDRGTSFQSKATLICIPSHLHAQWKQEIAKFTGKKSQVVDLTKEADLKKATVRSVLEADLVLCNYELLLSPKYNERRKKLAELAVATDDWLGGGKILTLLQKLQLGMSSFLLQPEKHPWSGFLTGQGASSMGHPLLELFFWNRVIFDELHEVAPKSAGDDAVLLCLRAHHFWGLTGTPLLSSAKHVAAMAAMLRVDVAGPGSHLLQDSDPVLLANCGRFLDACVRQNTAELPKIRVVQHLRLVKHTPQERALYLSALHSESWRTVLKRNERLLILCSHFSEELMADQSAGEACVKLLTRHRWASEAALAALCRVLGWRRALRCALQSLGLEEAPPAKPQEAEVSALEEAEAKVAQSDLKQLMDAKLQGENWCAKLRRLLEKPSASPEEKLKAKDLKAWSSRCEELRLKALETLMMARSQQRFLERTLDLMAKDEERSCVICFQDKLELGQMGITPCAHYFCLSCLHQQVERGGTCGVCRRPMTKKDIQPLMQEMAETEAPLATGSAGAWQKFGSKLGKVVELLWEIKAKDAAAKCIVFCQWDSLLGNIAAAFKDFGIRYARLHGSVYAKTRTLANFQGANSNVDVLLLSLEHSASGTNLTCANHVILVHPMNANTREQSVAFELQAIARVRRWGQPRNEVHVWRFCTLGTIEAWAALGGREGSKMSRAGGAHEGASEGHVREQRSLGNAAARGARQTSWASGQAGGQGKEEEERSGKPVGMCPMHLAERAGRADLRGLRRQAPRTGRPGGQGVQEAQGPGQGGAHRFEPQQ